MNYSHNMQAPCCQLLRLMCALTRFVFEGSAPLFTSLSQDAIGKEAGDMANAKGPVEG